MYLTVSRAAEFTLKAEGGRLVRVTALAVPGLTKASPSTVRDIAAARCAGVTGHTTAGAAITALPVRIAAAVARPGVLSATAGLTE